MSKNKKKLGYSQYEELLAQAHQKLEILAEKFQELQTYLLAYIDYKGDLSEFQKHLEAKENESRKSNSKESSEGNEDADNRKSDPETRNSEA